LMTVKQRPRSTRLGFKEADMSIEKKLTGAAKKVALKKIKDKLDDVPVQKIIDPVIEKSGMGKKLVVGGGIAGLLLAAVEYFL